MTSLRDIYCVKSGQPALPVDVTEIGGEPISTNAGTTDDGTQRVVIASDNEPSVNLQDGSGVDITSTTVGSDQALDVNVVATVGGGGGGVDPVGLKNSGGATINPATEDTLSTLNAKVVTVDTDAVKISSALPPGLNNIGLIDIANEPSVNLQDGSGNDLTSTLVGSDQALDVNVVQGATQNVNLFQVGGVATSVNTGNSDAGTQRVVLASDQPSVTVDQATHDNLNVNANLQVNDADNTMTNPVYTVLAASAPNRTPLYQFLTDVGDGTGTKNANGDYSGGGADIFYIQPGLGVNYFLYRLIFFIGDTTPIIAEDYGGLGAPLTNGITIRVSDNSGVLFEITQGLPIKANAEFLKFAFRVEKADFGGGVNYYQAFLEIAPDVGMLQLIGDDLGRLEILVNDDFTGLTDHFFLVQGLVEV